MQYIIYKSTNFDFIEETIKKYKLKEVDENLDDLDNKNKYFIEIRSLKKLLQLIDDFGSIKIFNNTIIVKDYEWH